MRVRKDIRFKIYGDIYVLEYYMTQHSHALWKCLCMQCNKIMYVTYSNLQSGNTNACSSCCKSINYNIRCDIQKTLRGITNISEVARIHRVHRSVVYRIKNDGV